MTVTSKTSIQHKSLSTDG